MKIKRRSKNKAAQTTLAYIIFIIVLIGAFTALMPKLRQRTQASYKDSADAFGEGRLAGSLNTSGGVAPFEFPELPDGQTVDVEDPDPEDIECDLSQLNTLTATSLQKQQEAADLSEEAGVARQEAADAQQVAEEAREVARIAREEATQARDDATRTRDEANQKQSECDSCNYNGEPDCGTICDEAETLAESATEKEGIATEKESIAADKEAVYQDKQAIADELDRIATEKELEASAAAAAAEAAAEALREMSEACAGSGGGGTCFLKGTQIALFDGTSKPIEEIKKGDMVFGYDGKQIKPGKVIKIFLHPKTKSYQVVSIEEGQQLRVTHEHRFFNGKTYVAAGKLKVGDELFLLKDNKLQAVKVKSIEFIKDSINDVYNLSIDKLHTYFAEGILCHNEKVEPID